MYTAEISRNNPSIILFLLDQSGSMQEVFEPDNIQPMKEPVTVEGKTYTHSASGPTKAQGLADAINKLLQNLCIKCAREEGVRNYFHVGVIGYGAQVGPALGGSLTGRDLVPLGDLAGAPARIETRTKRISDGAGGLVDQEVKFPIWFDAMANGGTPMCAAFQEAHRVVDTWIRQHPNCFPPIVVNLTDGESTDGDPTSQASNVRGLTTSDGPVLVFNAHVSSQKHAPVLFPSSVAGLPDKYAVTLFEISSPLTPFMIAEAKRNGSNASEGAKGYAFNADLIATITFLNVGTQPSNLR
jgi:hypothetical protein